MTLRVSETDLESYGHLIRRAGRDALSGSRYLERYAVIGGSVQGLFTDTFSMHKSLVHTVRGALERLHETLELSASELARSAQYYRRTDRHHAADLDATLPAGRC